MIDPRAAMLTFATAVLALAVSPNWLLLGWAVGIALGLLFKRSVWLWWHNLRAFGWMLIAAVGIAALFGSVVDGLLLASRLILFAGISALGAALIDPLALSDALVCGGMRPQFAFLVEGMLRFVPLMRQTIATTINAQRCRGIPLEGWGMIRHAPALVIPIVIQTLENATILAETLESRGFSSPHWTTLNNYRWRWSDWLVSGIGLVVLGIVWRLR